MKKDRKFLIKDINSEILVEVMSRKDIFSWLDEYIENLPYEWFDPTEDSFSILYENGAEDYISEDYDGHKIKRQHIKSMVYSNSSSYIVYGNFEINEYGVVTTSFDEIIASENIVEIQ